jgi:hypothetical protein
MEMKVEKLDSIRVNWDDFIHYLLRRFFQTTRLQYINIHIFLGNRFTLVLHLSHVEGDFGVTFNDINKDDVSYTTTSRSGTSGISVFYGRYQ